MTDNPMKEGASPKTGALDRLKKLVEAAPKKPAPKKPAPKKPAPKKPAKGVILGDLIGGEFMKDFLVKEFLGKVDETPDSDGNPVEGVVVIDWDGNKRFVGYLDGFDCVMAPGGSGPTVTLLGVEYGGAEARESYCEVASVKNPNKTWSLTSNAGGWELR